MSSDQIFVEKDVTDLHLECKAFADLSGSITNLSRGVIDGDIFDPNSVSIPNDQNSNDEFDSVQRLEGAKSILGFVSALELLNDFEGGIIVYRDQFDIYSDDFESGTTLTLKPYLTDWSASADLDLSLYDENYTLIGSSMNAGREQEVITIPDDGRYYIVVEAMEGAARYHLDIGLSEDEPQGLVASMETYSAIVQMDTSDKRFRNVAAPLGASVNHFSLGRALLAKYEPQTALSSFEQQLQERNPESLARLQTLKKVKELNLRPDVVSASPNYVTTAKATPNDPWFADQWHYQSINLPDAWDITTGSSVTGEDVIVAVIDTGVVLDHEDLQGQFVPGYDFISSVDRANDGDGLDSNPNDPGDEDNFDGTSSWHGTHVAGTIAAASNNNLGVAGVSWGAKIMPLRVLGKPVDDVQGTDYDLIQAILFAAGLENDSGRLPAQRADIINMSLGGEGENAALNEALLRAREQGLILIAAAGNDGTSVRSYPAASDGVVSVSATARNDSLASYSNTGNTIDVAAPGGDNRISYADSVFSTFVFESGFDLFDDYAGLDGTSMAAPHVAGVAALMKAVYPSLTPDEFDTILASGSISDDLGSSGRDDRFGHGLINARKAVEEASSIQAGGDIPTQPVSISVSPTRYSFDGAGDFSGELSIDSRNGNGQVVAISVEPSNASWLFIEQVNVDENGFGDYVVDVRTDQYAEGLYVAEIIVLDSEGVQHIVTVRVEVSYENAQSPPVYVVLYEESDSGERQPYASVQATEIGNGVLQYGFSQVPPGNYSVSASSNIDYHKSEVVDEACELGELCGEYRLDDLATILVEHTDFSDLDFEISIKEEELRTALE